MAIESGVGGGAAIRPSAWPTDLLAQTGGTRLPDFGAAGHRPHRLGRIGGRKAREALEIVPGTDVRPDEGPGG